jgi:hypothetical protein
MPRDREKDAPSLEPPSLFRRRKKPRADEEPAPAAEPEAPIAPPVAPPEPLGDTEEPMAAEVPAPVVVTQPERPPSQPLPPSSASPPEPTEELPEEPPQEPRPPREPWLGGVPAAAVTGLLVGALVVAATAGSLHLCSAVKGTSSCGGPGLFLLVAILVVAVLVGAAMLRGARVPEPTSTSFLAVGLLSVVTLLFLVGSIFEWWMVIAIPLCSVATFLLSYWVTTSYLEPAEGDK